MDVPIPDSVAVEVEEIDPGVFAWHVRDGGVLLGAGASGDFELSRLRGEQFARDSSRPRPRRATISLGAACESR